MSLIKSFIQTEFCLIEKKKKTKNFQITSFNRRNSNTNMQFLHLLSLNKTLKQYVQQLRFFFKNAKNPTILFWVDDSFKSYFLKELFGYFKNSNVHFKVQTGVPFLSSEKAKNYFLIVIGDVPIKMSFFHGSGFLESNVLFLSKFNFNFEQCLYGTYKTFCDINSIKKFLFIFIMLKQSLTTTLDAKTKKI